MKKLLIGTSVAAALVFMPPPAKAILGVGDVVFDPSVFDEAVQQLQSAWQQLQTLQQQLSTLTQTYQEAVSIFNQAQAIFNSLNHITSIGGALSSLDVLGIQNPLPIDPQAVISLTHGSGGISGMGFSIPSLFNNNWNNNHIYDGTGNGYESTYLQNRATSIAGVQGLAGQLYQSMAQRLQLLTQLQAQIDGSDAKDLAALQARIASEQTYIQAQGVQAQALAMMQQAGMSGIDQQRMEQNQKNIDEVLAACGCTGQQ